MVTEFHYHESPNYSIQVEFWTDEQLTSQLRDLIQAYRQYKLRSRTRTESTAQSDRKKRYELARDTFSSMFRGRLLDWDSLTTDSEDEILERFEGWISELHPRQFRNDDNDLSLLACAERLACLASDQASPDSAPLWPYIRKVKYETISWHTNVFD